MVRRTEEEVINYIKENMVDSDGVVTINNTHPSWVYDYLRHRYKTPEARVEWVREKTGALLWVGGYNTAAVLRQRLRANNLIRMEKVNGKLVERLYSVDLSEKDLEVNTIEDGLYAQKITKLRKAIKDNANKNGLTAKEYVEQEMGVEYVNQVRFRSFLDVDRWIIEHMGETTNADILRKIDGFNNVRDFLKNNWKINNEMYSSPFVDYIKLNFPKYSINAMLEVEKDDRKQYYFNILLQHYPKRVIQYLKKDRKQLYDEIKRYRNTVKGGPDMTLKEFIEDYIGDGMFVYITKNSKKIASKWTKEHINQELIDTFGEGDVQNPVVIQLRKNNRNLAKQIEFYCHREDITSNEFLNPMGYMVDNERQIGNPGDSNTRRVNTTHAERGKARVSVSALVRNGRERE